MVTIDGGQNLDCNGDTAFSIQNSSYNIIQGLTLLNFGTAINIQGFSSDARYNLVGFNPNSSDPPSSQRNVIGGNCRGIYITGQYAFSNTVAGNFIGTDASGSSAIPNNTGIYIVNGAHDNMVGSASSGGSSAFNTADLEAYWTMDEANGNALDAVGSNDLIETSGLVGSSPGVINYAVRP